MNKSPVIPSVMTAMASLELRQYMAAKSRVAELEASTPPDFSLLTVPKLRMEISRRYTPLIGYRGRTNMIQSLVGQMNRMRTEYKALRQQELEAIFHQTKETIYARPALMLASTAKETPGRLSFLSLPGEIRNMIYDLALFESPQGDYAENGIWELGLMNGRLHLKRSIGYMRGVSLEELRQDRTISAMNMLAAMCKQIHQEVRTFFWSHIKVILRLQHRKYYFELDQFFYKIGPQGRGALCHLVVPVGGSYFEVTPHQDLLRSLPLLPLCKNLRVLTLCVPLDVLFGSRDRKALEAFFLRGEHLNSPSLNDFANLLRSFPRLKSLRLQTSMDTNPTTFRQRSVQQNYFRSAFTRMHKKRLVGEIADCLKKIPGITVQVMGGRDYVGEYQE